MYWTLDMGEGIADETAIKLMHKEVGILRKLDSDKDMCI
jgi:hypothetical protein